MRCHRHISTSFSSLLHVWLAESTLGNPCGSQLSYSSLSTGGPGDWLLHFHKISYIGFKHYCSQTHFTKYQEIPSTTYTKIRIKFVQEDKREKKKKVPKSLDFCIQHVYTRTTIGKKEQ